jgi:aspartyl/asparaginyl-tRNA synthetase
LSLCRASPSRPPSSPQDVVEKPFATVTYTEAIKLLKASGHKFEYPVEWGLDMQSEHERFLSETVRWRGGGGVGVQRGGPRVGV